MKVFIGMSEVAGYFTSLTRGLKALGADCTFFCGPDVAQYYYDEAQRTDTFSMRVIKLAWRKRCGLRAWNKPAKAFWYGVGRFFSLVLFAREALRNDVFIFAGAESFLGYGHWDLRILKLLGKKILVVFSGSDHRPPYLNGLFAAEGRGVSTSDLVRWSRQRKERIRSVERYADIIVGHHLAAHFHERRFVPLQLLGIPRVLPSQRMVPSESENGDGARILHAPSVPKVKGSDTIRAAIQNLKDKGYAINLIELTGRPNSEILEELARCSFVVDEVYSDIRLAGLSTEAATFGKPTVVGGYADDTQLGIPGVLERADLPPILYCHPDEIQAGTERLLEDAPYRRELGERARRFVEERWTPEVVAEKYLRLLDGTAPGAWFFDPSRLRYLHGYGLSEERVKAVLREVVEAGGVEALQLSDKPELERLFLDFAQIGASPA